MLRQFQVDQGLSHAHPRTPRPATPSRPGCHTALSSALYWVAGPCWLSTLNTAGSIPLPTLPHTYLCFSRVLHYFLRTPNTRSSLQLLVLLWWMSRYLKSVDDYTKSLKTFQTLFRAPNANMVPNTCGYLWTTALITRRQYLLKIARCLEILPALSHILLTPITWTALAFPP